MNERTEHLPVADTSEWPCFECGAVAMGHCRRVGCAAMREQITAKNAEIDELRQRLSEASPAERSSGDMEWIPVSERMPDDGITVLTHFPGYDEPVWLAWRDDTVDGWRYVDAMPCEAPTHWMPLPEPPK